MSETVPKVSIVAESSYSTEKNPIQHPLGSESLSPLVQSVWIIFGARCHLSYSLVQHALSKHDLVTVVGQASEDTLESLQGWHSQPYLSLLCDIRVRLTVDNAINRTIEEYGRIDIVVSFFSFGVVGACEDQSDLFIRGQFDRNFMGTLNIIQASLPLLREYNSGRYIILSTTCGGLGAPGLGPYCAMKGAVESLTESMIGELDPLGIKITAIETGLGQNKYSTDSNKLLQGPSFISIPPSEPYGDVNSPLQYAERMIAHLKATSFVNTASCAELIWQLAHCQNPPPKLALGSFAIGSCRDRLRSLVEEIEDWEYLHFSAEESSA
ncbi:MAG: hypothetical protein M1829_005659 [Trizodia sp. TS-e1964]|nr:MAG: hypothetical protein M1829_005659 [Trizodia sp. TS-e1964]